MSFKKRTIRAFSLVELSIALAITGILVSGSLLVSTILVEQTALEDTITRIDEVDLAIKTFVQTNGRLPCPASQRQRVGDSAPNGDYGMEYMVAPGNCSFSVAGHGIYQNAASGVYVGTVPVRTLGIPDKFMADAYGNRFIYAVTETLTSATNFSATVGGLGITDQYDGTISVTVNSLGETTPPMAYVLVSAGADGEGAYRYKSGTDNGSCTANAQPDQENCDGDAFFADRRYNDGENNSTFYDDIIRFTPKFLLTEVAANGVDNLCTAANEGLLRYDEDAQRFYHCVATAPGTLSAWRLLSIINIATPASINCDTHQINQVRQDPDNPGQFQYCNGIPNPHEWADINP